MNKTKNIKLLSHYYRSITNYFLHIRLSKANIMAHSFQEMSDVFSPSQVVFAQILEAILQQLGAFLDPITTANSPRIAEGNEVDSGFFFLECLYQLPDGWMVAPHQMSEAIVPSLADIVGTGVTIDCGFIAVSH